MYAFEIYRQGMGDDVWVQVYAVPSESKGLVIPTIIWEAHPAQLDVAETDEGTIIAPMLAEAKRPMLTCQPVRVMDPMELATQLSAQLALAEFIYPAMVPGMCEAATAHAVEFLRNIPPSEDEGFPGAYL